MAKRGRVPLLTPGLICQGWAETARGTEEVRRQVHRFSDSLQWTSCILVCSPAHSGKLEVHLWLSKCCVQKGPGDPENLSPGSVEETPGQADPVAG